MILDYLHQKQNPLLWTESTSPLPSNHSSPTDLPHQKHFPLKKNQNKMFPQVYKITKKTVSEEKN